MKDFKPKYEYHVASLQELHNAFFKSIKVLEPVTEGVTDFYFNTYGSSLGSEPLLYPKVNGTGDSQ